MNLLKKSILVGGCVAAMTLFTGQQAMAQGRNFDPAAFRQMRVDRAKEQLEIKDEDWKALEPLVGKVFDAQSDVMRARAGGMGRGQRHNRGNSVDTNRPPQSGGQDQPNGEARPPRPGFFGEQSAAVAALQKAIEANAPVAELKTKIAAVRAETKEKEAKLEAAEEDLRGVLSTKQEANAVVIGLLR
jgi:hypothetical protein